MLRPSRHRMLEPDDLPEYHIMGEGNHQHDIDCWCEPHYYRSKDAEGNPILVVEHDDRDPNLQDDWITKVLSLKG